MTHIPYRTGITTMQILLRKLCQLGLKYRSTVAEFLTAPQLAAWDALMTACEVFLEVVPNPRP